MSTKLTKSAEDWSGNSGSPCCLMCLCVVVVSLFRLCHITRVYVGFFSFLTCFIRCPSQCRLSVVFVLSRVCVCVWLSFISCFYFSLPSYFFYTVLIYVSLRTPHGPPPRQADTRCCSGRPYLPFEKQTNKEKKSFPALFTQIWSKLSYFHLN